MQLLGTWGLVNFHADLKLVVAVPKSRGSDLVYCRREIAENTHLVLVTPARTIKIPISKANYGYKSAKFI